MRIPRWWPAGTIAGRCGRWPARAFTPTPPFVGSGLEVHLSLPNVIYSLCTTRWRSPGTAKPSRDVTANRVRLDHRFSMVPCTAWTRIFRLGGWGIRHMPYISGSVPYVALHDPGV